MTTNSIPKIAFVGGGNMASAILGGLRQAGHPPEALQVIEPWDTQRERLYAQFGLDPQPAADASLADAALVVWAIKPQLFAEAAAPCAPFVGGALHLSVMAGIPSDAIARATGATAVVRAMPNTPALIGQGMTGLFARPSVSAEQRGWIETVLAPTGRSLWVAEEADLDAVTALSGSGPAYVFYVLEALIAAGVRMGLPPAQARELALGTFAGATALAAQSDEPPSVLRERVTSKGGTTYAALQVLQADAVQASFERALIAARDRAQQLAEEFGR